MSTISIKPKQSIYLLLNQAYNMDNPRISIRLEENVENDDEEEEDGNQCKNSNLLMFQNKYKCQNCDSLKQMLLLRDRTIMKLVEDRDQLKIKLTKAMNQNIEFSRQLIKYQHVVNNHSPTKNKPNKQTATEQTSEKVFQELEYYKKKCQELDNINQQLRNHLYSLRNVFAELGNVDNCDDEYQELPSVSCSLDTFTHSSSIIRNNNNEHQNAASTSDNRKQQQPEDNQTESGELSQPSINNNQNATYIVLDQDTSADSNNEQNVLKHHQPKIICECDKQIRPPQQQSSSNIQTNRLSTVQDHSPITDFDQWYNS